MTTLIEAPPVAPDVTTADILYRAADILEQIGWCQGALCKKNGIKSSTSNWLDADEYCATGAVDRALAEYGRPWVVFPANTSYVKLILFNDANGRTREEVVDYLRELAASAA